MSAGIAPGVTNLLAAQLLEENPGADEAELVFTVTAKGTGGAASAGRAGQYLAATTPTYLCQELAYL